MEHYRERTIESPSFSPIASREKSAAIRTPSSPIISPSFSPVSTRDPRKMTKRPKPTSTLPPPASEEDSIYAPLSPSRPSPASPLRSMFSWSPPPSSASGSDPSLAELVSRELFAVVDVTDNDDKCDRSACSWTSDSHSNQCQKQVIINR